MAGLMPAAVRALVDRLVASAPREVDLTNPAHETWAVEAAEALMGVVSAASDLSELDARLTGDGVPVALGLALKLATGRRLVQEVTEPAHLSVVLAVYKENVRILSADEDPSGEDFLRRKLAQLSWLFADTPHSWDLAVVDDGCPEGSGAMAQRILEEEGATDHARVLFLDEAIEAGLPPAAGLESSADSRKGGSIRYGLWHAVQEQAAREQASGQSNPNHVVLFTDADLSTHLGQSGLLLEPIVRGGAAAAIGSRRESTSVVVKQGKRNTRGKLFIYLWKQLIPQLRGIIDTQCGFKAFRAETLEGWFEGAIESGFAFDIEMLIHVHQGGTGPIRKVAVAWIDSDALSTTTDLEPYLDMLQMAVQFYRAYLPADASSDDFARLIEGLDKDAFDVLLGDIPTAIAEAEPVEFDDFHGVSAAELATRAGLAV
jgi:glycerophosphoryl diester phosphodiesterase